MYKKIILLTFIIIAMMSCEDPVPTDYEPQNYLEAALIVGQPIDNIVLMRTQPIQDTFNYEKSLIRDAEVIITGDGKEFKLLIDANGLRGYYSNEPYVIKGNTKYNINIRLSDGATITGNTLTPDTLNWIREAPKTIQYPIDTVKKESRDTLIWEGIPTPVIFNGDVKDGFWGISIIALDTLQYGTYLDDVPDSELNRRLFRRNSNSSNDSRYKELANWGIIPSKQTPVIWQYFKWYGLHEISVYNMDNNYLSWVLQRITQSEYDERLSSVKGNGIGVFGSMTAIRDTFFLIKNQP